MLTPRAQALSALLIFALTAWLVAATMTAIGSRHVLAQQAHRIERLESAYAQLVSHSQLASRSLTKQVEALERLAEQRSSQIEELRLARAALMRELEERERDLAALSRERDRSRDYTMIVAGSGAAARTAREAGTSAVLRDGFDPAPARQAGVWQIAEDVAGSQVARAQDRPPHPWFFKDWVSASVESLQALFADTGVDLEIMVARAEADGSGQGGPFEGIDAASPAEVADDAALDDAVTDQIRRLSALQKLANSLPLAAPLEDFRLTSRFGKRRDPFSRRWAFHGGLDFGARAGAQVVATAPGRVLAAGPAGPYGLMVEIDHGMGVTTRYAHLNSIEVEAGAEVAPDQPLGIIGSTGRSTGRHLHYEIRIDDRAYNPAKFIEAGRHLADVFRPARDPDANARES